MGAWSLTQGFFARRWRIHPFGCCSIFAVLHCTTLFTGGRAQVLNLRFTDEDTTTGKIGGTIYWEKPTGGDDGYTYRVCLSTSTGATCPQQLPISGSYDLAGGAGTSAFPVPSNTAIGSYTYILVFLRNTAGTISNQASIFIQDNPTSVARTVYVTTLGYTKANNARTALVTAGHTNYNDITLEMVATAKWDTGTSAVVETVFDDVSEESSTAAYLLTFPTGATLTSIDSTITSYITDAPLKAVYTGTGAATAYSHGVIQAASVLDSFVPNRPDPDIARYIARSCVHFGVAGAAMANRAGYVRIHTKATAQTAVKQIANMYINTDAVTFLDMGAASADLTAISTAVTQTQAQCYQVTGTDSLPSCISPYTV